MKEKNINRIYLKFKSSKFDKTEIYHAEKTHLKYKKVISVFK